MERSPCRGCPNEYESKDECLHRCTRIGRVRMLAHQFLSDRTRPDYTHVRSHTVCFPA